MYSENLELTKKNQCITELRREKLTSNQHNQHGTDFLVVCVWRNIAKANRR